MASLFLFLDTSFAQALLNPGDQYHDIAVKLQPNFSKAKQILVTDVILIEIADALSRIDRDAAADFIDNCRKANNIKVVRLDTDLFDKAFELYRTRSDKTWGLTDCLSFVVMQANGLSEALTADRHFGQAGYRALMLEAV